MLLHFSSVLCFFFTISHVPGGSNSVWYVYLLNRPWEKTGDDRWYERLCANKLFTNPGEKRLMRLRRRQGGGGTSSTAAGHW